MRVERGSLEAVESGSSAEAAEATRQRTGLIWRILAAIASPRVTVFLVLAAIGIVMIGTLAQVQADIWEVVGTYFRAWLCWVDLKILFPVSFFPWAAHTDWNSLPFSRFPFPGGASIGLALAINLAAAHVVRFPVKARGARLAWGLLVLAAGAVITWLVIASGHNRHGLQGEPLLEWSTLWGLIRWGLALLWAGCVVGLVRALRAGYRNRPVESGILGACVLSLGLLLVWIFSKGADATLTASSLRILYQLIQAQIAASVLLAACAILFGDRAGNVLLHGGLALLMFGEFFVSCFAEEQQMTLVEGQSVNFTRDTRSVDLAISMPSGTDVFAIPMSVNGTVTQYAHGETVNLEDLPFDLEVLRYYKNSQLVSANGDASNPATVGLGTNFAAEELPAKSGVQSRQSDVASAYVKLTAKQGGKDLGTVLVSQHLRPGANKISVGGADYILDLQFKHCYKPYEITLLDVRKDDYTGTSMARNYASRVRLQDPSRNVDFEAKIWMNNPLRYAGETFYQSGYNVDGTGKEVSTLQVVKNTGWMMPYVACMIVATGMLVHFVIILLRFLKRTQNDAKEASRLRPTTQTESAQPAGWLVPAVAVLFAAAWVGVKAMPPHAPRGEMRLEQFGALPLMYEGRVKPFDTLARNSLRIISNRQTYTDEAGDKQPAIRWLLDVIARPEVAEKLRVFRIESTELQESLGLERRKGSRYALEELRPQSDKFRDLAMRAQQQEQQQRAFQQRKMLELVQRVNCYQVLADAFRPIPFPSEPTPEEQAKDPQAAARYKQTVERLIQDVPRRNAVLNSMQPPLAVPAAGNEQEPWQAYAVARNDAYVATFLNRGKPAPMTMAMAAVFDAYRRGDAQAFNKALGDYDRLLAGNPPAGLNMPIVRFEAYFNHFEPFYNSIPLYFVAFLLTVFAWLAAAMSPRLATLMKSASFWLIVVTFAVHTFALGARVVISGRPPVTNLYSSAVFIGWGCVAIGLLMEIIFRMGVGNLVSTVAGIGTLVIAHILAGDGDTIKVLQAVLDTQFWLTVHVLTITLGYSAMFLAGLLGLASIAYRLGGIVMAWFGRLFGASGRSPLSPADVSQTERALGSMIYGAVCFAAFFSLTGTILGGLWADDSWGRFWGWDPKENGALIIVLWTALVLHANAARMVRQRGLAVLAVGGNIFTSWSWFGVNELGVGLHAYGFTEGVASTLLVFWLSQLVVIGLAVLPGLSAWIARPPTSFEGTAGA